MKTVNRQEFVQHMRVMERFSDLFESPIEAKPIETDFRSVMQYVAEGKVIAHTVYVNGIPPQYVINPDFRFAKPTEVTEEAREMFKIFT